MLTDAVLLWLLSGLGLLIVEMFTQGAAMGILGLACFSAAVLGAFNFSLVGQFITFSIVAILGSILLRPLIVKYFWKGQSTYKSNVDGLIGVAGFVTERIDQNQNTGYVRLGSEDWQARTEDNRIIEKGSKVTVTRIIGCTLTVSETDK